MSCVQLFPLPRTVAPPIPQFEPSNKNLSQKSKNTYYDGLNLLDMRPIGRRGRGIILTVYCANLQTKGRPLKIRAALVRRIN